MSEKEIVILAKSIKHGNFCVAGKDVSTKKWIRLVSDNNGSALTGQQILTTNSNYKDTYQVKTLHKVKVKFSHPAPLLQQPENEVINPQHTWQQNFSLSQAQLANYVDSPETLWGCENRLLYEDITQGSITISQSLYLVPVSNLSLYTNPQDKRKAHFTYNDVRYTTMSVTDPNFDKLVSEQGFYKSAYLVISLGEKYTDNYCYKMVAAIYIREEQ